MSSDKTNQPDPTESDSVDHLTNLQRLTQARWWVFAGMSLLYALAASSLDIPLSWPPIVAVIALACLFNAVIHRRYRAATGATAGEMFRQLLFDMSSLSALIFFSGGATNPLVSLLLPPVAIAALTLPARYVSLIVITAIAAYSALLLFYLPLPLADPARATRLHLTGMWLTFAASSVMIAWFILRMTRQIRQRDAELAAAREQGLRDERILAIGTLAAGAAHELGTPLGTMLLITGELAADPKLPLAALDDIQLLNQQIMACKDIITKLSRRAGAERLENTPHQPVDRWLAQLCAHWQALRPQTNIHIDQANTGKIPDLLADPRLEQALLNLLNNAANASHPAATTLTIRVDWNDSDLIIELIDQGPGFPPAVLELAGKIRFPPHAHGQGIGLMLTHSAIEQLGGKLELQNQPGSGALARITLPRIEAA